MAYTDSKRAGKWMLKKTVSLLADVVKEGDNAVEGEIPASTGNYLVAHLPANAVIKDAYVMVIDASDAATSAVVSIGTTEAGQEILADADLKTEGPQGALVGKIDTGTGLDIYLHFVYTGAATEVGKYVICVEYDEYTKNDGEYTEV